MCLYVGVAKRNRVIGTLLSRQGLNNKDMRDVVIGKGEGEENNEQSMKPP